MASLDHDLRDANLLAPFESITQKRVSFVPAFLRFQIVGLIKKHGIDFIDIDEVLNIDRLGCFQIDALKILIFQHDVFPFFVFVALHDLVPGNFFAVLFGNTLVIYGTQIAFAQQTKLEFLAPCSGIKRDGNINQPEADTAFPDCAHTKLFRMSRL